ncbi:MAG: hypothetical protein ABW223_07935 [Rariglobus sp.]
MVAETEVPALACVHMGWVLDFFRLTWGFFYWNLRKTFYRRQWTKRCPCQHPSDSGRAWETACVAVLHWNKPARFQRVCPLLQRGTGGEWRCSVNRAEVRPFWGRAAAFYATSFVVVYLVATLSAFAFLRTVGYGVTYPGVAWPPAWSKFTAIRTEFFLGKYQAASRVGDPQSAMIALSTAYNLNPQNYPAGLELAKLWQVTQPGLSNRTYRRLIDEHPGQAEVTAQTWFRALLARGDFVGVEQLAIERIIAEPDGSTAWLSAFLFSNQRTRDADSRRRLSAAAGLSRTARFLLRLASDLEDLPPEQERGRLLAAATAAGDSLSFYQVCRELVVRGFAQEALTAIDQRPGLLSLRDVTSLRLDAMARLGWTTSLRSEVESLLVATPDPLIVELLSAHLIRYPSAELRERVFARLARSPLPENKANYPAYLSLFCAAGAGGDVPRVRLATSHIKKILGGDFKSLDVLGAILLDRQRSRRIENYLPALQPLSLDVTYALFEQYAPLH